MGHGQRVSGRGTGQTDVIQLALIYAAHHREDRDAPDVITRLLVESITTEVTVLSPLGNLFSLDCVTKRVILRTEDICIVSVWIVRNNEVVKIGECQNYLASVISALVAEKLVYKGCEVYLAYVSVSTSGDSTVKDIYTVRDFSDVFSEELPGLPLNRKVEFGIKLLPGTTLMSIAPYRMALKELTELKAQI
ncbi:uncharacterized protein LOC108484877 [Gossypium arboreum]|uniref:uncharacterized protein LOC108484877 n=1 Tax=Gossypium arboreum TaxID=29729 RepID=UPI000818FC2B|nr:uncharacterized protein LOC108484877 [Gossypium arboreum]